MLNKLLLGVITFQKFHEQFCRNFRDKQMLQNQIIEASLYVWKKTVANRVLTIIEKTPLKTPAVYPYTEVSLRTSSAQTCDQIWRGRCLHNEPDLKNDICNNNKPHVPRDKS